MNTKLVPGILGGVIAALVIGVVGVVSAQTAAQADPSVVVTPTVVDLDNAASITIVGSGFQAGQELRILRIKAGSATSDLTSTVDPELQVDDEGMFATSYEFGRMPRDVTGGPAEIVIVDENYQPLARAPIVYCVAPAEGEEAPAYCPQPEAEEPAQ